VGWGVCIFPLLDLKSLLQLPQPVVHPSVLRISFDPSVLRISFDQWAVGWMHSSWMATLHCANHRSMVLCIQSLTQSGVPNVCCVYGPAGRCSWSTLHQHCCRCASRAVELPLQGACGQVKPQQHRCSDNGRTGSSCLTCHAEW
jgi:hypothetical protein